MITPEMLKEYSKDYDRDKYSEEFYTYHLSVLQNAQQISKSVSEAVRNLFLWKLGRVRSKQTPSTSPLGFSDPKGRQYYSIPTAVTHQKVIKKATEEERLKTAISFRNRVVSCDEFKFRASNLTSSTIVLPAFYIHIWRPDEYPILDQKVWIVFCAEKGQLVNPDTKPRSWSDYEAYTSFFRKLVGDMGLDRRAVDQGLWVHGGHLMKRMRSRNVRPHQHEKYKQEIKSCPAPISPNLLDRACYAVSQKADDVPFRYRGIMITRELIKVTMELLNSEPTKELPQNCRNDVRERTPDGLDKRIKESLNTNLRTGNIISDVLRDAGIIQITQVRNPQTHRSVKGTKLLQGWCW